MLISTTTKNILNNAKNKEHIIVSESRISGYVYDAKHEIPIHIRRKNIELVMYLLTLQGYNPEIKGKLIYIKNDNNKDILVKYKFYNNSLQYTVERKLFKLSLYTSFKENLMEYLNNLKDTGNKDVISAVESYIKDYKKKIKDKEI